MAWTTTRIQTQKSESIGRSEQDRFVILSYSATTELKNASVCEHCSNGLRLCLNPRELNAAAVRCVT
jgi:hypothetical protein